MKPKILHRDAALVAMHKPAGMTVYQEPGSGLSAMDWLKPKVGEGGCFPVHRLDKGTCGVLLFALSPSVASLLQKLFREGKIAKGYLALVHGATPKKGDFRDPLTDSKSKETRAARTLFRTIRTYSTEKGEISLVEVDPKTGRFHQIRRHFDKHGFPLVGDEKYGPKELVSWAVRTLHLKRPALSAVRIEFVHPRTRKSVLIRTTPDADFQAAQSWLERSEPPT